MNRLLVSTFLSATALIATFFAAPAPTSVKLINKANATPKADFVFIIDATPSMGSSITAVKAGLSGFVNGLQNANIDARFAVVLTGGQAELVQDFTNSLADTTSTFSSISVNGAVAGFQINHAVNPEAGLEAIRIVLGASSEVLVSTNVGGNGILTFRPDANKNIILVTDEDSDLPFYASNQFAGQAGTEPPSPLTAPWQAEINATAQAVIANNAFVNMLINTNDAPSTTQYGNPASSVSDANFLNFDPAATLVNLTNGGFGNSLEAQVLASGLIGRAFNISQVNTPNFINNFFAAKVEEVVEANTPPVFVNTPGETCSNGTPIEVKVGVPFVLNISAESPELDQTTTLTFSNGNFVGANFVTVPGQTATATCTLTAVATQVNQTFTLVFTATDNGTPNLHTQYSVCVKVTDVALSVTLESFHARALPNKNVHVAWKTAAEIDNAGFNIYRRVRNGGSVALNDSIIPAVGSPFQGESYEWTDAQAEPGSVNFYWLESIDIYGESEFHGPVAVTVPK